MEKVILLATAVLLWSCRDPELTTPAPDPDNGGLILPGGFGALVVADSVGPTRHIAVHENGNIYAKLRITEGQRGNVAIRDGNNDGRADEIQRFGEYENDGSFATDMRIHEGYLYFSSERIVYRQQLTDDLIPPGKPEAIVIDLHPLQWHNAKSLAFDQEGGLYVTFSAPTNACEDWNSVTGNSYAGVKGFFPCPQLAEQGGIWRFDANRAGQYQTNGVRFASGLRSVVGIAWNHADNSLYAVIHGRDYLHSHAPASYRIWENAVLPAEEFVRIRRGDNFGWPYAYYDPFQQKRILAPEYGGNGRNEAKGYRDPLMGFPAHWAPNDLLFYQGDQFPAHYKKGAFIAFHGSTNRAPYPQGGYVVAFVPFENGNPTGRWEVFADGFAGIDPIVEMKQAKYRPMGLAEGPDGSLYISESVNGKIWRIIFTGDKLNFGAAELASMEKRKTLSHLRIPDEVNDLMAH
jgi:glucose/arabinose dehydrogenase